MNTKQKLHELITKHKDNPNHDTIVNDLCRLYFEVEEQEKKESPFEGSQLKETKDSFISHQGLIDLGFNKESVNKYYIEKGDFRINFNLHIKEVSLYDYEEEQYILLPNIYIKFISLKKLVESLLAI